MLVRGLNSIRAVIVEAARFFLIASLLIGAVAMAQDNTDELPQLASRRIPSVSPLPAYHPAGAQMAVPAGYEVIFLSLPDLEIIDGVIMPERIETIASLWWSLDGATVYVGGGNNEIIAIDRATLEFEQLTTLPSEYIWWLLQNPADENQLAAFTLANETYLIAIDGSADLITLNATLNNEIFFSAWSPDGAYFAHALDDNSITLWNIADDAAERRLEAHTDEPGDLAFSPDGTKLATTASDGLLIIWDVTAGEVLHQLAEPHGDLVNDAVFSPDGTRLASVDFEGRLVIWDVESGTEIATTMGHSNYTHSPFWSPDGAFVVTMALDETIIVWDVAGLEE